MIYARTALNDCNCTPPLGPQRGRGRCCATPYYLPQAACASALPPNPLPSLPCALAPKGRPREIFFNF
jgi:hypothetical protein